jgi:cytochrome b561
MSMPEGYSAIQKWLHWTIAALIIVQLSIGVSLPRLPEGALTNALYELHKSFGLTILALALLRIAVRSSRGAPPLEPNIPGWQRAAAYTSHYALYTLIVLVPVAGWTATSAGYPPVRYFWTIPVTLPIEQNEDWANRVYWLHAVLALALALVALVHAGAALHHHFVRRDRTLLRMLPGTGSSSRP